MKKKKNKKIYWGKDVEENVKIFIENRKKWPKSKLDRFFTKNLYEKFYLLSENILRTYSNRFGFDRIEEEFNNLIYDCVAEIYYKLDYFDPERGTKSFSYFGTLVKNYLIQRAMKTSNINSNKSNIEDFGLVEVEKNFNFLEDDNADEIVRDEEEQKILDEKMWCLRKVLENNEFTEIEKEIIETFLTLYENSNNLDFYNKKYVYVLMNEMNKIDKKHYYPALKKFMSEHDKYYDEKLWN